MDNNNTCFIFVDETYLHFGKQMHQRHKITQPKGADPTQYPRFEPVEHFQLMPWGAIGPYEDEIPFPYWIYDNETGGETTS